MLYRLALLSLCCLFSLLLTAQSRIGLSGGYFTSAVATEALDPLVDFEPNENTAQWTGGYYVGGNWEAIISGNLSFWTDLQIVQQRSARNGGGNNNVAYFELKPRLQYRFGERIDVGVGPSIGYSPTRGNFGFRRETNFGIAASVHVELGDFFLQTIYTHGLSNVAFPGSTTLDINNNLVAVKQRTRSFHLGVGYLWAL